MDSLVALSSWVANFAVVNADIQNYLRPIMVALISLAGVASAFFLVLGGFEYMTSSGKPDKLEHAKKVLRNALIGLSMVIAAGALTAILTSAYTETGGSSTLESVPVLQPAEINDEGGGVTEVLINSIIGLFKHFVDSAASPIINAVDHFTKNTPLMADNKGVLNLWLGVLGISNALLVLVVALLGFQVMSAASLGLDEIEFKHLLPKIGATFLIMNMSIFAIDAVISLTNVMISAIASATGTQTVFNTLSDVMSDAGKQGLVSLLLMIVFIVLSVLLLVYYVVRVVTLYVGAVLSPMVVLLQLVPGFRDFTTLAVKAYISTIFNLFVHVIILAIAATLFVGLAGPDESGYNPLMSLVGGIAAIFTLLKTQQVMMQLSYASNGSRALRKMGTEFISGISYMAERRRRQSDDIDSSSGAGNGNSTTSRKPKPVKEGYQ